MDDQSNFSLVTPEAKARALQAASRGEPRYRKLRPGVDFDEPRRRLALVWFSSRDVRWHIERGGGAHQWTEVHSVGELLFGPSPWRRACVLPVFGRLGSVEAAVSSLAKPGDGYRYAFEFEQDPERKPGVVRARYLRGVWEQLEAVYYGEGLKYG